MADKQEINELECSICGDTFPEDAGTRTLSGIPICENCTVNNARLAGLIAKIDAQREKLKKENRSLRQRLGVENKQRVYIVGRVRERTENGTVWDYQGLFCTHREAVDACKGPDWFIGPAVIGDTLEELSEFWPGLEFPWKEKA